MLSTLGGAPRLVRHVTDRPGHDRRYAVDTSHLRALVWAPTRTPRETVAACRYAENGWRRPIRDGKFHDYHREQYGARLAVSDESGAS